MNVEAQTEGILNLLLGEGREFKRMDQQMLLRFERFLDVIVEASDIEEVRVYRSFDLKFFNGHYQVRMSGEKRLWFEVVDGEALTTHFGSTDHSHGETR